MTIAIVSTMEKADHAPALLDDAVHLAGLLLDAAEQDGDSPAEQNKAYCGIYATGV